MVTLDAGDCRAMNSKHASVARRFPYSPVLSPHSMNPYCMWQAMLVGLGECRRQSFTDCSIGRCQGSALLYIFVHSFKGNNPKAWLFTSEPALRTQLVAAVLKKTYECSPRRVGPSWLRSSHDFPHHDVWTIVTLEFSSVVTFSKV